MSKKIMQAINVVLTIFLFVSAHSAFAKVFNISEGQHRTIHFTQGRLSVYGTLWMTSKEFAFKVTRHPAYGTKVKMKMYYICDKDYQKSSEFVPLAFVHYVNTRYLSNYNKTYKYKGLCGGIDGNTGYFKGYLSLTFDG
jgi:hypothetical protein